MQNNSKKIYKMLSADRVLSDNAFARNDVPVARDNMCYLGISEGPQDYLVLVWSQSDDNNNRWMTTVRALESLVSHNRLPSFKIAVDPVRRFGFILCPDTQSASSIRACYVQVGQEKIFFDLVRSVKNLPFGDDYNQHLRILRWI